MKWDRTIELGYLDERESQGYFYAHCENSKPHRGTERTHGADMKL